MRNMMVMVDAAEFERRRARWNLTLFASVFGREHRIAGGPCALMPALDGQLGKRGNGLVLSQAIPLHAVSHAVIVDSVTGPVYRYEIGRSLEKYIRSGVFLNRIGVELGEALARVSVGFVGRKDALIVLPSPAQRVERLSFMERSGSIAPP